MAAAVLAGAGAFAAVPSVTDVTAAQDPSTLTVTIGYALSGGPAVITADILTNGVSIGASGFCDLAGDVNQQVDVGARSITWHPVRSFAGHAFAAGELSARVTVWPVNDPPPYMAVSLVASTNSPRSFLRYYAESNAVPGGVLDPRYRTEWLLMRKMDVAGKTWIMGCATNEVAESSGTLAFDRPHAVTFRHDYYIGVFEVTQKQYDLVVGSHSRAFFCHPDYWETRPMENNSYWQWRSNLNGQQDFKYPAAPGPDTFFGLIRAKTGLAFDMPSEAQWEYAARGGHGSHVWGNGLPLVSGEFPADNSLRRIANFGRADDWKIDYDTNTIRNDPQTYGRGYVPSEHGTMPCGSFEPNDYGLYDMNGNVAEWCLDNYVEDISDYRFGEVVTSSNHDPGVIRGGSFLSNVDHCRNGRRCLCAYDTKAKDGSRHNGGAPTSRGNPRPYFGTRACLTLDK